jgi:hypothetical protein
VYATLARLARCSAARPRPTSTARLGELAELVRAS